MRDIINIITKNIFIVVITFTRSIYIHRKVFNENNYFQFFFLRQQLNAYNLRKLRTHMMKPHPVDSLSTESNCNRIMLYLPKIL